MMKKLICLITALPMLILPLCGCGLEEKPASFGGRSELPEDGIVEAAVLERLKNENRIAVFCGNSGGVRYEWTVFGSAVQSPEDTCFALDVLDEGENALTFRLRAENGLGFAPLLSIYPHGNWNADGAVVYLDAGNGRERICTAACASIDGRTVLNFAVGQGGTLSVLPNDGLYDASSDGGRVLSDGTQTEQDKYLTDPVPEGRPMPQEPDERDVDGTSVHTCTLEIECTTIFNNIESLEPDKLDVLPADGMIFESSEVEFYDGESVYDVLERVCRENGIHMEASWTPIYNSVYIEGIHNLYEFDCGSLSGWMYRVNGWYPNYGCSRYRLEQGDVIEWRYTCDLGADVGGGYAVGAKPQGAAE